MKSKEMQEVLDAMGISYFGNTRTESLLAKKCISCNEDVTAFRSELSAKEYTISGLCQVCQDGVFGGAE